MPRIAWLRFQSASVVSSIVALEAMPAFEIDDVDAAEALDRRARRPAATAGLARDVALHREPGRPEIGDRRLGAVAVEVERDHGRAERGERVHDRAPDAARRRR